LEVRGKDQNIISEEGVKIRRLEDEGNLAMVAS
jgi:hypothetical protein